MSRAATPLQFSVGERASSALLYPARKPGGAALILAHGAGAPQTHPFLVRYAEGLAARGVACATFNFLYTEDKRRSPDPKPVLEACWRAAIDALGKHAIFDGRRRFIGGKSMGGRIATQVAAEGVGGVAGVVLLGYPLHPPGKPDQLRVKHLPSVRAPMLFIQGERDAFGTPEELRPILASLTGARLRVVDGGDHSFAVTRKQQVASGQTQDQVHEAILDDLARWLEATGT